nr:type VI secretion system-associated FHA domain protein TagH [Gammaproteobacteria bacterium]
QSRTELKNAIRTDVTRLARENNNPLKFSTGPEDAMMKLLAPHTQRGFLPADTAIDQAIDDLKMHQLAMLEGMKAAVRSMLVQFDPDKLEQKLEKNNRLTANIPITREAKLWELFQEKFSDIREEAVSDFNELFGREFRKAYDRRIKELGRKPDF